MDKVELLKQQAEALNAILGKGKITKEEILPEDTEKEIIIQPPLSFEEAKMKLFKDPNFRPKKYSQEHFSILELMRLSKERFEDAIKNPDKIRSRMSGRRVRFAGAMRKEEFLRVLPYREAFLANLEIVKSGSKE